MRIIRRIALTALVFTCGACGATSAISIPEDEGAAAIPDSSVFSVPASAPVEMILCIDTSGSVPTTVPQQALTLVASGLEAWAAEPVSGTAVAARPQLTIRVRSIGSASGGSEAELLTATVPALDGVDAPPPVDELQSRAAWSAAFSSAETATVDARRRSADVAAQLHQVAGSLGVAQATDISGCLNAAALTSNPAAQTTIVAVSDFEETTAPDHADVDLTGTSVLLATYCDSSTSSCEQRVAGWRDWVSALGGSPSTYRVERLDEMIQTSFEEMAR
jgi:hypothetical protein